MKKIILISAIIIICAICLQACSKNQINSSESELKQDITNNLLESEQNEISDGAYSNLFSSYYFNSIEGLYQGLCDFDKNELEEINFMEDQYMDDTRIKTHISEDEEKDGIFGSMINELLISKITLVPYYRNKEIVYINKDNFPHISVCVSDAFRKPCIVYGGLINSANVSFTIYYFDKQSVNEAKEKGASWLISQLQPDATNIYNYEEIYAGTGYNPTVYEKEYKLGDRNVLAMVIDHTSNGLGIVIYFVYDDILVCTNGDSEFLDSILPDITFREVSMPTNTPLRNEPGREDTIFSTRNYEFQKD